MAQKINVYLQYPWKFPDSPYYKYLVDNPPKQVTYLNVSREKGVLSKSTYLFLSHNFKRAVRLFIGLFKIPMLNAYTTKSQKDYDLIHCAHCLSKNKNKKWIVDFEGRWQFYLGHESTFLKNRARKILLSPNCKKIVAWTNRVKEELLKEFPEIYSKVEVIYPAVPSLFKGKKKHKGVNLFFSGRYFYRKGGLHALEAIDRLTKQNEHVRATFLSDVPKDILKKYKKNKKITFYSLVPQKKLFEEIYPTMDLFVYPGYRDSFGYGFLESMSFGLPVITLKGFARDEIIHHKKEGIIIDLGRPIPKMEMKVHSEEIVQRLVEETQKLIDNAKLREFMSRNCVNAIKNGRFSIAQQKKNYERIYSEALK